MVLTSAGEDSSSDEEKEREHEREEREEREEAYSDRGDDYPPPDDW